MRHGPVTSLAGLFLVLQPFAPSAGELGAQAPSDGASACTVQVTARTLDAGLSAVRVWAYFDRDIGRIRAFRASEGSGIRIASADLLARIRVTGADPGGEPGELEAITMGPEPRSARLWLSLFEAEPGEHPVTLEGDRGRCRGVIRVDG